MLCCPRAHIRAGHLLPCSIRGDDRVGLVAYADSGHSCAEPEWPQSSLSEA